MNGFIPSAFRLEPPLRITCLSLSKVSFPLRLEWNAPDSGSMRGYSIGFTPSAVRVERSLVLLRPMRRTRFIPSTSGVEQL